MKLKKKVLLLLLTVFLLFTYIGCGASDKKSDNTEKINKVDKIENKKDRDIKVENNRFIKFSDGCLYLITGAPYIMGDTIFLSYEVINPTDSYVKIDPSSTVRFFGDDVELEPVDSEKNNKQKVSLEPNTRVDGVIEFKHSLQYNKYKIYVGKNYWEYDSSGIFASINDDLKEENKAKSDYETSNKAAKSKKSSETLGSGESQGYTNDQLEIMALDYYERHYDYRPGSSEVIEGEGNMVIIHLYDMMDDHAATVAWYTVNRKNAIGQDDIFSEYVDLNS